jgi:hypothetical protein
MIIYHGRLEFEMVQGEGFEPPNSERADLQSAVFNHFTIPACDELLIGATCRIRTDDLLFTKQLL